MTSRKRRAAVVDVKPPCTPTGSLADPNLPRDACASGHPYVCDCGAALRHQWQADGMDWYVVDADGRSFIDRTPPPEWWQTLPERDIGLYSNLTAAMNLGASPFVHVHHARSCWDLPHVAVDVPTCCAMPMRLVRDGWVCRVAGTFAAFVSDLDLAA